MGMPKEGQFRNNPLNTQYTNAKITNHHVMANSHWNTTAAYPNTYRFMLNPVLPDGDSVAVNGKDQQPWWQPWGFWQLESPNNLWFTTNSNPKKLKVYMTKCDYYGMTSPTATVLRNDHISRWVTCHVTNHFFSVHCSHSSGSAFKVGIYYKWCF